jgi:hypothetical protein
MRGMVISFVFLSELVPLRKNESQFITFNLFSSLFFFLVNGLQRLSFGYDSLQKIAFLLEFLIAYRYNYLFLLDGFDNCNLRSARFFVFSVGHLDLPLGHGLLDLVSKVYLLLASANLRQFVHQGLLLLRLKFSEDVSDATLHELLHLVSFFGKHAFAYPELSWVLVLQKHRHD